MNCKCGCNGQALYSYVWDWGESGVCCESLRFILNQKAARLNRRCTITPLDPGAPSPITRDERVVYNARILALQDELTETQARALTVSEAHREVCAQLQTTVSQYEILRSELEGHRTREAALAQALTDAEKAQTTAQAEVERLTARLAAYELAPVP